MPDPDHPECRAGRGIEAPARQSLPQIALEEFHRRRAVAREGLAARQRTLAQAELLLRPWAALVRWLGADLPADAFPPQPGWAPGEQPAWIDLMPARRRADDALADIAHEVRRATLVALLKSERDPTEENKTRAIALTALDIHLSIAAGLGPLQPPIPTPASESA